DPELGGLLGVLFDVVLELALEERGELRVRRGLGGERRRGGQRDGRREAMQGAHSTLPMRLTTLASLLASASQNARNCGWSRYCTGVSTLASAALKLASSTANFAASRSLATAASGVPAGTNSPVHCENCAS